MRPELTRIRSVGSQPGKMFAPNPSHLVRRIVLIFGKPEFTLLANHVENLSHTLKQGGIVAE